MNRKKLIQAKEESMKPICHRCRETKCLNYKEALFEECPDFKPIGKTPPVSLNRPGKVVLK